MKSLNKKIAVLVIFVFAYLFAFSQQDSGYLFRVYTSSKPGWETLMNYPFFSCFLSKADLMDNSKDSIYYTIPPEGDPFPEKFSKIFSNRLQLIETAPNLKEKVDQRCELSGVISINQLAFYDLIYTYRVRDDFHYIIVANKITMNYCALNRYTEYDFDFKAKLAFRTFPYFLQLGKIETDLIRRNLGSIVNLKGTVFFQSP